MAFHRLGHGLVEVLGIVVHLGEDVLFIDDADDAAFAQHRELRHVVELHALVSGQYFLVSAHGRHRAIAVPPADEVAQIPEALAFDEALVEHPEIVVDLGEVLVAAVADQRDDALGRALLAAIAQRCGQQRPGRRAGHQAFLQQELATGEQRFAVRDAVGLLHARQIAHRRHEILADSLDHPGTDLRRRLSSFDERREDRALGIGEHHLGLWRDLGEEPREAGDGAAGADAAHHRVEAMLHLLPDLGTGAVLVGPRVRFIAELVDVERAGGLARDACGHVLVIVRVPLGDVRAGEPHFRTERLQVEDFFLAHLVGHDDEQAIAFLRGDEREAKAGISRCRFDDQ